MCPRPRWRSSTVRLPRSIVVASSNVSVGWVSPGIVSAPAKRRGIRAFSDAQSARPRSSISAFVSRVGHDPARVKGRRTERADRVVVGQHEIPKGQVADAVADDIDPLLRHERSGARLDGEDRVGPDDAADVRVALGGEGEDAVGQGLEGRLLLGEVRGRSERPWHAPMIRRPSAAAAPPRAPR